MQPTIGRIVVYHTTKEEQELMKSAQVNVQETLPAMIVAVWSDTVVNLKVFLDGNLADLWKTSSQKGNLNGEWDFPVIVK